MSLRIVVGFGRRIVGLRRLGEWSAGAKLAVHQEALVDVRDRLHRIDICHEASSGLRLTGRNQRVRLQATQNVAASSRTTWPACEKMS